MTGPNIQRRLQNVDLPNISWNSEESHIQLQKPAETKDSGTLLDADSASIRCIKHERVCSGRSISLFTVCDTPIGTARTANVISDAVQANWDV